MKKIIRIFLFTAVLVMAMTGIVSADTSETTEQLYWINGYDAYDTEAGYTRYMYDSELRVDSDGKIVSPEGSLHASELRQVALSCHGVHGFFAIKENGNYYAVDPSVHGMEGKAPTVRIYKTQNTKHYALYTDSLGNSIIQAEYKGKIYKTECTVWLDLEIGESFFEHPEPNSKNMITTGEFRFDEAAERNAENTEVYFYTLIEENLELILWDRSKRMATEIRGIIIENEEETINLNGEALQLCKITLTDEYETTNNPEVWFNLKEKSGEALHDVQLSSLKIYGADTEPMLHVFNYYSTSVQDDKLTLSEEIRKWGSDLSPFKNIGLAEGDNNIVYFAIKQGTEYCLVNDIDIAEEGLNIKDYEQSGAKCLEAEKAGSYTLNGMYNGKDYSTTLDVVKFRNFGYFKKPERAKSEEFIGRFAFDEAVEKNEAETEAYFYVIAEAGNRQLNKVSLSVSEIKTNPNPSTGHDDFKKEQKKVEGIEIKAPYETDFDGIRCFIWKITVADAFQPSNDDRIEDQILFSLENFDFRANDGNISGMSIHIVGKSESKIPGLGKFIGSGRINAADALYLRRSLAGWENYKATLENADINQDGVIDKADVIALERHIAGWKGYGKLPMTDETLSVA